MAAILPFRAIRPNPVQSGRLIFSFKKMQETACDNCEPVNVSNLKILLESGARIRPEIPELQEKAFQEINKTFGRLLEDGELWRERIPGFYVYEISHKKYRQTGIWTLTDLNDYTTGKIKTHELTFTDSIRRLKNYREKTALEGSPVLLTYSPTVAINRIIAETRKKAEKQAVSDRSCFHRLWKIDDEPTKRQLIREFAKLSSVYLADGHHRLAAAAKLKAKFRDEQRKGLDTISSLYIATDQLRICAFNRVVIPDEKIDTTEFLKKLSEHFIVLKKTGTVAAQSKKGNMITMGFSGNWFDLFPKKIPEGGIADRLDSSILQTYILGPLLGITDPATDGRLKCVGGDNALQEVVSLLELHPNAIAFTLCALTVQQLTDVADANEVLPPKSTWIDPKVPYGLIMYKHQTV